ncbi:hypothetical protein [Bacillus sp. ISL-7]|uniref:hypothetical protein n=1 Tax=Bacillus sp. ISL-7 TaxID=2819136 RepID=UPI0027DEBFCF|nr:hypothetical protein [Bacillus sp. ISL-7]
MSYIVDFKNVSTVGLESSPIVEALAGLRANEARYFMNKYKHEFTVVPASESRETLDYVNRILKEERDIEFAAKRGRSRLRRFLYLATMSLVMNNPEFKAIHAHNVKVKKMKKMKSIMKLVGKLARIFVGIAKRNESYCPEKVQPLTTLAA